MAIKIENPKVIDAKNRIILCTGCGKEKRLVELFNFQELSYVSIDGVSYIRITCDGRYYHYKTIETSISGINIYDI